MKTTTVLQRISKRLPALLSAIFAGSLGGLVVCYVLFHMVDLSGDILLSSTVAFFLSTGHDVINCIFFVRYDYVGDAYVHIDVNHASTIIRSSIRFRRDCKPTPNKILQVSMPVP